MTVICYFYVLSVLAMLELKKSSSGGNKVKMKEEKEGTLKFQFEIIIQKDKKIEMPRSIGFAKFKTNASSHKTISERRNPIHSAKGIITKLSYYQKENP